MTLISPENYACCGSCAAFTNAAEKAQKETGAHVVCGSCTKGSEPGTAELRIVIPDGEGGATIQEGGEVSGPGAIIELMDAGGDVFFPSPEGNQL